MPQTPEPTKTITFTLTPENAEALKDYMFWTGVSEELALNHAFQEFMEARGEDELWDIARLPKRRAAAFRRNKLSKKQIASWNRSLNATFEKLAEEGRQQNAKLYSASFQGRVSKDDAFRAKSLGIILD